MGDNEASAFWPEIWRGVIAEGKSWVVFEHGTCVVVEEPFEDLRSKAVEVLREYGPVRPGSAAGDFGVIAMDDESGWVVTYHHPDVLNYVENLATPPNDTVVGLLGRQCRSDDALSLNVIHVEDNRV